MACTISGAPVGVSGCRSCSRLCRGYHSRGKRNVSIAAFSLQSFEASSIGAVIRSVEKCGGTFAPRWWFFLLTPKTRHSEAARGSPIPW